MVGKTDKGLSAHDPPHFDQMSNFHASVCGTIREIRAPTIMTGPSDDDFETPMYDDRHHHRCKDKQDIKMKLSWSVIMTT